jgi:hypothetical protein
MKRLLLAAACVLCLSGAAAGQPPPPQTDGVTALLGRLEQVLREGAPARYGELLTREAARDRAEEFADENVLAGATRVVVRERDRGELPGVTAGEGDRLLVEVFVEFGSRARLSAWRLDVRRLGPGESAWGIAEQEVLSAMPGLYRLLLNPTHEQEARDLVVSAEDLRLVVPDASVFIAETVQGPTVLVILGRGEMSFTPAPKTERGQLRIFAGSDTLQTGLDALFVRVNPSDLAAHLTSREMVDRPVDPKEFKRADEVFRQDVGKSFGLSLGDLSADSWSLVPSSGDFLAEVHTHRFDTLTYARSGADVEDLSLFDRKNRHNIAVYASQAHLARYTRFYSDDDKAEFVVRSFDLNARFTPSRLGIEGLARLAIEVRADSVTSLTLRLADPLIVESVVSSEFGRLMSVRVRHQNSVVINLPSTVVRGYRIDLAIAYAGSLPPQPIDREALAFQRPQIEGLDVDEVPLAESYLYSNRSYWYPQAPDLGYATGTMRIVVPVRYTCVASGMLVATSVAPGVVERGNAMEQFVFDVSTPLRYLACLVAPLVDAKTEKVALRGGGEAKPPSRTAGARASEEVELSVQTSPRLKMGGRQLAQSSADILRFYTSLIGDFPYPSLTVVAVESKLPGGHSPGYMAVVAEQAPGPPTLNWSEDPGVIPGFPEFFLAHEIAHQWWGQAVGWKNYHEQWLSEGFAQYFAALYAERVRGPGVFEGAIRRMYGFAMADSDQGPIYLGYRIGHVKGDSRLFRAVVYNKGALVLHMLRRFVGDPAFFRGIRRFYETWRCKKAGSDDLRRAMEEASGLALSRFFDLWVYGDSLPQVAFSYRTQDLNGTPEALLRFVQAGEVFDLPVTVTLDYLDRPPAQVVVTLTRQVVEVRVPLAGRLRKVDVNRDEATLGHFR